ncbi:MAG: helix-turn-helix transcriptional regulator [Bacilli bacterium]|nr:helix-turn-helix transcriptional regulator [Bacilli bacterium]MDD4282856.1 helix-turn-helix transcriptional regulator [Bacilli bacterium]MDD4718677.1 helix-turn-helix transcriptional regulator [Bacilli bacterium]
MYFKLKEIRKQHNLTGQKMADMLGISKSFYSQLENGLRKLSYHRALEIAQIFNVKPDDIFYVDHVNSKKEKTN